jgi:hypothetical protein
MRKSLLIVNVTFFLHLFPSSLFYASFLLLSLALVGSLVLVNLILALILSDVNHLYSMCRAKELFRKARQVVFFEKINKMLGMSGK